MFSPPSPSESRQNLLVVHTDPNAPGENVDGVEEEQEEAVAIRHPPPVDHDHHHRSSAAEHDDLPRRRVLAYSIGHFYNDLCASMWFTYLLIFLEKVVNLLSWQAGMLMFIGQVTDALSTPLVGMLSDLSLLPGILRRFGRRKSWHIIGTICVTLSFPLIFSGCLLCYKFAWLRVLWFVPPIMLFQFGWAAVQISHLAMIPELTRSEHTRMSMTSYRYGFTVAANLSVFACLYLFLAQDADTTRIGPVDLISFRKLSLIAVGFGALVTAIFYAGVSEPSSGQRRMSRLNSESGSHQLQCMSWHNWFRHRHFYQVAALYVFSRVYINISQVYLSFYIVQTHHQAKRYVALLPLTAYLSSMLASLVLGSSSVSKRASGKPLFSVGALIGLLNCVALFHPPPWPVLNVTLFVMAGLLGLTQAVLLICSLSATAQLINQNTESGAFVYGAMSFLDKLSNGIIVWLLELYNPSCRSSGPGHGAACARFYRDVISFVPGGCAIGILIILIGMDMHRLGQRSRRRRERNERVLEGEGEADEEVAQQPQHGGQDDREREQQQRRRIAGEFDLSHPALPLPPFEEVEEEEEGEGEEEQQQPPPPSNPNIAQLPE